MKRTLLILAAAAAAFCLAGCKGGKTAAEPESDLTVLTVTQTLTEIPSEEYDLSKLAKDENGAYIIFNGENFDGWRGILNDHMPEMWVIEDGAMKFLGKSEETRGMEGGDILFMHQFKNFEFEFEWKVDKGSNSGVFYLIKEYRCGNNEFSTPVVGPEYQILDNENHKDAKHGKNGNRQSASLYDMIPAQPQNALPWGEWNTGKIVVNNGVISHYQNGVEVVKYTAWTPEWEAMLRDCKWAPEENPIAFECQMNLGGKDHKGYVGFQDHNNVVWFRNIKIKEL